MSGCVLCMRAGQVGLYQKFMPIFGQKLGVGVVRKCAMYSNKYSTFKSLVYIFNFYFNSFYYVAFTRVAF